MLDWRFYGYGWIVDSDQAKGDPLKVPGTGGICVVSPRIGTGRFIALASDWYYWLGDNPALLPYIDKPLKGEWATCDLHSLLMRFSQRLPTFAPVAGQFIPHDEYQAICLTAKNDSDFPPKGWDGDANWAQK